MLKKPEKILCGLNPGHLNFVENVFATIADLNVPVLVALKCEFDNSDNSDIFYFQNIPLGPISEHFKLSINFFLQHPYKSTSAD